MTLTPQQIEVLARFDGWAYKKNEPPLFSVWEKKVKGRHGMQQMRDVDMLKHLTSPGVLIEMRLKLHKMVSFFDEQNGQKVLEVGNLILSGDYTAAAIKTSEIIQKLEA